MKNKINSATNPKYLLNIIKNICTNRFNNKYLTLLDDKDFVDDCLPVLSVINVFTNLNQVNGFRFVIQSNKGDKVMFLNLSTKYVLVVSYLSDTKFKLDNIILNSDEIYVSLVNNELKKTTTQISEIITAK